MNRTAKPRKTKAEYQKAYREREKAKKNENQQESTAKPRKTKAEYQKEYRERQKAKKKKNMQESTAKPRKTKAEYQKEYRERQKAKKKKNMQKRKPPKTNAEHQKAFRERQKMKKNKQESTAELNAPSKTKKSQSENCKEYQQKCRLKKQRVQLEALLFKESELPQSNAHNRTMEKQLDAPEDFTNEPLPSKSEPMEVQNAVASTLATPFSQSIIAASKSKAQKQRECRQRIAASRNSAQAAVARKSKNKRQLKKPITAAPKTRAQIQREYRQRIAASRTPAQAAAARETRNKRDRNNRLCQAANLAIASGSLEATITPSSCSGDESNNVQIRSHRQHAQQQFTTTADQPDEHVNLTNEPLFPAIPFPTKIQEAVASTSATTFAEPVTAAPKTRAQIQREYRQRIAVSRTPAQAAAAREARNKRDRNNRLRQVKVKSEEDKIEFMDSLPQHATTHDARTAYNHTTTEQCDKSMDIKELALPLMNNVLPDEQNAVSSMSATPFADPLTITAPKSKAQKQREYRQRLAATRTAEQLMDERKANAERQRSCRLRKTDSNGVQTTQRLLTQQQQTSEVGPAPTNVHLGTSLNEIEVRQAQSAWNSTWASSIRRFKSTFLANDFGHACSVCDRLWFKNELKPITALQLEVISQWYIKENLQLCGKQYEKVCNICRRTLNKKSMPPLAKVNGFSYPDQPPDLPPLDPISERLISPRLPFMQIRRLRYESSYGINGQVVNIPKDVQDVVKCLPRQLHDDDVININIERKRAHNSVYISDYVCKSTISAWLTVLCNSPLYRFYKIDVDMSRMPSTVPFLDDIHDDPSNRIQNISAECTPESEILASRQHSMIWTEEDCLNIVPGHQAKSVIYDYQAEELSFPSIYFGEPRQFNKGVSVTPSMIADSEIRRRDRRGATPQKILYVAIKILRLRITDGIYSTFRNASFTENVTRRMLENTEFLKEYVTQNLAFMKTVPNSVQYWASRKRDLFAIIRHLGKPTVFLTISANEIRWMNLLTILLKLSKKYPGKTAKDLITFECCTLVNDDPVTCCIYFHRLVGSLIKMLKSKQTYNPFGKYFIKDYFLRIDFQHQGSPQAHMLLWLNDDPHEAVSETMPRTIELVEKIFSAARHDVPNDSIYSNQIHKHTLSCTELGETTCKFGIPYWPMCTTRVLVPIPQSDGRHQQLQQKGKELRISLDENRYSCMDDFLNANGLTYVSYLNIVRSTLRRPTLLFKRNFEELMTNTFNPYLAGEVNSHIDIQFILDEYSCAEYIAKCVNKSTRGMSNLRCEVTTMMKQYPGHDYTGQLKALSSKLVNAFEMSAQEAAWYLLRQPMCETSRQVLYIPTVWPTERQRCRKRRRQMDREGIDGDSTDVWTKNIIHRYEERPASLEQVYLAEFAAWYANANDFVDEEDDVHVDDDDDSEAVPEVSTLRTPREYRRRPLGRVIRYRRYNTDETVDHKREMTLLYVPFRNEVAEILDENKFLQLYDANKETIMQRHNLFETNLNIQNVMKEIEPMILQEDDKKKSVKQ